MKTFSLKFGIVLVAIVVMSFPMFMAAQAISGDLLGVVSDSSGAVVPNAQVVATNLATGAKTTIKTNANGEFHFVNLPIGHYSLEMSGSNMAGGYKDVQVQLNRQNTANITAAVSGKPRPRRSRFTRKSDGLLEADHASAQAIRAAVASMEPSLQT